MEGNAWLHDEHYPTWHEEPRWRPADPRWDVAQTNLAAHLAALPRTEGAGWGGSVGVGVADPNAAELALASLWRDGAVVLEGAATAAKLGDVLAQLGAAGPSGPPLGPLALSTESHALATQPTVLSVADAVLGRQALRMDADTLQRRVRPQPDQPYDCLPWGIGRCATTSPAGGDGLTYEYAGDFCTVDLGLDIALRAVWPLEPGGCTVQVATGSHLWPRHRAAEPAETEAWEVEPGSVLLLHAGTWHNRTDDGARSLTLDYQIGNLRTPQDQFAANPPHVAATFPLPLQKLVGYTRRGGALGYFADEQHPAEVLRANWPGIDHVRDPAQRGGLPPPQPSAAPELEDTDLLLAGAAEALGQEPLPPGMVHVDWLAATDKPAATRRLLAALSRDGAVVLANAVPRSVCDALVAEAEPYVDIAAGRTRHSDAPPGGPPLLENGLGSSSLAELQEQHDGVAHRPEQARRNKIVRVGAVAARCDHSHPFLAHPAIVALCEAVLGRQLLSARPPPERMDWTMHISQLINVQPGCDAMGLHRDGNYIQLDVHDHTGLEVELGCVWALQDFSAEVGATRAVLGSHNWPRFWMNAERNYPDVADVPAVMGAGSCIIYLGQTWHAAGANATDIQRHGLMASYVSAFLAEEELQSLANPPHVRARFPPALAAMLGRPGHEAGEGLRPAKL